MARPKYCPCEEETPDPCPACGATVEGNDPVRGVCQARFGYRRPSDGQLVLIDKETGAVVASTR
jgi:hypothetical protein